MVSQLAQMPISQQRKEQTPRSSFLLSGIRMGGSRMGNRPVGD